MIASLEGDLVFTGDRFVVLNVHGVGYKIYTSTEVIRKIRSEKPSSVFFWTHLVVREDVLDLYGFLEYAEIEFFNLLIGISGVGPKSALGIVGIAPLDTLKKAIATGDITYLTKVSGIGRKIAEKIILELREKIGVLESESTSLKEESDVIEALQTLGYSTQEAREALKHVSEEFSGTSERITAALKYLGKK